MSLFTAPSSIDFSLRSQGRRFALLLAIGFSAALVAGEALRVAIASTLGESLNRSAVAKALELDPTNSEFHRRLALEYLYGLEDLDPDEGVWHLRRATELNPHVASYWADLGSACDLIRDTACADEAFERALSLSPMTPRLYWILANHYLRTNRTDAAMLHFQRLLVLSPPYATQTFALCLRALNDSQAVSQKVLPTVGKDPKLHLAFINFLCDTGKADFAYQVWVQTAAKSSPFAFSLVQPYLDRLLDLGRYVEMAAVWQDLGRLSIVHPQTVTDSNNLIYNGGFEQAPLNSGLDWHLNQEVYVSVDISDPAAYQGARCLRLDFSVNRNEEYEPLYQIVPVAPRQSYLLTAYVRSENLTSDSGPRLRALDPVCWQCLNVTSEMTVGTTSWHRVSLRFTTGTETRVARVSVWRPRSRTFPTEISGRFWMDAVSIQAVRSVGADFALEPTP